MGVAFEELTGPVDFAATRLEVAPWPEGGIVGARGDFVLDARDNNAHIAVNRILADGGKVRRARAPFDVDGRRWPAGTILVSGVRSGRMEEIAREARMTVERARVRAETVEIEAPRLGHYMPWTASMDEGWMRWILEEYGFPYTSLLNDDIRAGSLGDRYDVISLASLNARSIVQGNRSSERSPVRPEYAGGIGEEGVEHLKEFVRGGGTLICNAGSSDFAIEAFGLPVLNVMQDRRSQGFYAAGSVVRMEYAPNHPVAWGMVEQGAAFLSSRDRVFELVEPTGEHDPLVGAATMIARLPAEPFLISGYTEMEELLYEAPTALAVPYGDGRIILFGFNFHNRAQSHATFKLFFNAIHMPRD
jgi:hypothetical protein